MNTPATPTAAATPSGAPAPATKVEEPKAPPKLSTTYTGPDRAKLSIPFLTPTLVASMGRADALHLDINVTISIDNQTSLARSTYEQMVQLTTMDPELTLAQFQRIWRSFILKRSQDVYEKSVGRRANHYLRLAASQPVPAPLADLLYSIGQYYHAEEGRRYIVQPPAQAAQPEDWWQIDDANYRMWLRMMGRFKTLYTIRETPPPSEFEHKPLSLCVNQLTNNNRVQAVRARYNVIEMTDGLISFVNDELWQDQDFAFDDCSIGIIQPSSVVSIRDAYVYSYVISSNV